MQLTSPLAGELIYKLWYIQTMDSALRWGISIKPRTDMELCESHHPEKAMYYTIPTTGHHTEYKTIEIILKKIGKKKKKNWWLPGAREQWEMNR